MRKPAEIFPASNKNQTYLDELRHSTAHLLAAAVIKLWPDTKPTIGPPIQDGFYYDFEFVKPISEADLTKIEAKMHELLANWKDFKRQEVNAEDALKQFSNNPYKQELIREFSQKGETISLYSSGDFTDLCRGGHVQNPSQEMGVFKLLSIAGAYWRGSEKNTMLTRIYGTAFSTLEELEAFVKLQQEAKARDHRKIGQDLGLFTICDEVGPGLILWLPKGNVIREELEAWAKETEKSRGYEHVSTPHITKAGLFYTSGHLPYYKKDMYPPMILDGHDEYYLKPMNCPHHHMIFKSHMRSYRELPMRIAEYGMCYRYEASGELFGLMRVRGLQINDAHIYCTAEQAVEEFTNVMKLHEFYYQSLGIKNYHLELALRDPKNPSKYHGDEKMWEQAESLMRQAVQNVDIEMVEEQGSAAFYGPKIDFIIHSSIGREFAVSTNQIDLYMGKRFDLNYIGSDGKEHTPVIIHRAPLGSHERFIGFLIEHFGGAFPVWLSPIQVRIIPISTDHVSYANSLLSQLKEVGIRAEVDDHDDTMQAKIREAQLLKIPYMAIVGDKEKQNQTVNVRLRDGQKLGEVKLGALIDRVDEKRKKKLLDL